jgi:hypothetical protein
MFHYNAEEIRLMAAMSLMVLGIASILCGLFLLVGQAAGKAVQTIAAQTTRLAQKGVAEEIAGLVGNARALVDALNQLAKTSAGIGIFLFIFGIAMLLGAFFMAYPF